MGPNNRPGTPGRAAVVTAIIRDSDAPGFDESTGTSSLATGDIDQAGHLDLVVGTLYGEPNVVYFNDGLGNFPKDRARLFGPGSEWTTGLAVGDLDGNGSLDVVTGAYGEQNSEYDLSE